MSLVCACVPPQLVSLNFGRAGANHVASSGQSLLHLLVLCREFLENGCQFAGDSLLAVHIELQKESKETEDEAQRCVMLTDSKKTKPVTTPVGSL